MKPYKESKNGNIIRRTFSHDVLESELVWHRDHEDRIVLPLNENDWMIQFDNQLPTKLMVGEEYHIPKNVYHRVIKGNGDLMVEIIKTDFNEDIYEIYELIDEGKKKKKKKKDACYHKVRARYDVWPSAYASGALVKCRKVGAANWGNKSNEGEEPIEEKWSDDYKKSIDCNNPKGFSQKAHCDARKKRQRGEETKSKPLNESIGEINRFVKEYIKNTNFDIENSLGNCSFFTKDVVLWAKKNGYSYSQSQYVYMPMSEKYRKQNNISDSEWEDHIVPMINGYIIDFTYTPQGVSKKIRTSNTIPPAIFKFNESLFKPSGAYGKFGYTKPEINHVYGKRVGLSTFDTEEPKPKDTPNNPTKTAKRQFAKDLQKDPDYIKHIENSMGYGSVNATSKDPFISKTKYSRIGKDELDELTVYEAKKTDFSKEKSKGLHGWFERQGGKGKSKGWVDCNTCRKDPETGRKKCKTCGRKEGEERAKYPACRPTPSACGTRGKGKHWGKKSTNENLNVSENFSIFDKNYIKMKVNETFNYEEPMVLPSEPKTKPKESPMVQPSRRNKPFLPERESQPDPKAEK
jgi:hypothetical protein